MYEALEIRGEWRMNIAETRYAMGPGGKGLTLLIICIHQSTQNFGDKKKNESCLFC